MTPVLGTAMWGWTVGRDQAFALADTFHAIGGRWFDTASNYPIDGNPDHFGLAEHWLADWFTSRGADGQVIVKVGALLNDGSNACDLSPAGLRARLDAARDRFGTSLGVFSIHWDERDNLAEIEGSVEVLRQAAAAGYGIGLSGIRHPHLYAEALGELGWGCWVQVKHNVLSSHALAHYEALHDRGRFLAYGLNAGGLKLGTVYQENNSAYVRDTAAGSDLSRFEAMLQSWKGIQLLPTTFNELALAYAGLNPRISGVLLGPSRTEQLTESMNFLGRLDRIREDASVRERLERAFAA
ncbi:aldo/keto reductase [Roseomonas sp. KE2513]|uniref:aldo/keto reductase n=1 Tax=Roseomonas sp. KE2513 TaxID=2479202 RepID=UPI0018E03696|nr:aldo/keto reductase [Roseomonas sp. KE2513]